MACDPAQLLEDSKCFQCNLSGALFDAVEIVLLCAIRDGDVMACDPSSLAEDAKCILTCIPQGQMQAVKLAVLCEIAEGGGVGGGCACQVFTGAAPPALPTDPTKPALFFPTGGGSLQQFDVLSQSWV